MQNKHLLWPFSGLILLLSLGMFLALYTVPAMGVTNAGSNSPLSLEILHEIPIDLMAFVRQGDYYYGVDQDNFYVIDAQDPTYPHLVGTVPGVAGYSVDVAGEHAYVGVGLRTVVIVDVSNPNAPFVVSSYSDFEAEFGVLPSIWDIVATEETLFVSLDYFVERCPEGGKVAILDVTDPANPVRVNEISLYSGGGAEIEIMGDFLYHLFGSNVIVYDVSKPGTVIPENAIGLYDAVHHRFGSIALDDNLMLLWYVNGSFPCEDPYGLPGWFVVDVSDPYNQNPNFLVYQENTIRAPAAYEDGYLFSVDYNGLDVVALPDINEPLVEADNVHKRSMNFNDGVLTFLPESGVNQDTFLNYFSIAHLFAASATVSPTMTSALTYTDSNGMTEVLLPAGAVEYPAEVSILPLPAPDNPPEDLWLKQAFDIRGHYPAQQQTLYAFQQPLTATLPFTADPAAYPLGWQFLYWNETKWEDAAETCTDTSPAAQSAEAGDALQVTFCLPGKYGLFVPFYDVALPVIHR